jgi:hypothetical protein
MFALCTSVTCGARSFTAYSKAYLTIRSDPSRVMMAIASAAARGSSPI